MRIEKFLTKFRPSRELEGGNCKNSAWTEVCTLRVLPVVERMNGTILFGENLVVIFRYNSKIAQSRKCVYLTGVRYSCVIMNNI